MLDNYLEAEGLIIARIKAEVSGLKAVLPAADLAGVAENAQPSPAVHVIYAGDQVPGSDNQRSTSGALQKVTQQWYAVVAVRNARTQTSGAAARETAGPIITQVLAALAGWQPADAFKPLKRVNAPPPKTIGTFAYFPLLFTTEVYT